MKPDGINISRIINEVTTKSKINDFTVCWIKNEIDGIEINNVLYPKVSNSIFFIDPKFQWRVFKNACCESAGYIMYLDKEVLNYPVFKNLHINKVRLFNSGEIPLFKLSPGIEVRTQAILEMIDELLGSDLNHKDDAILSLLNTFFIYCDGQCNIKSEIRVNNAKTRIVFDFKKLVDAHLPNNHDVNYYAGLLNITPKYLNECVQEILLVSSKSIIIEQLLMRSRHELKFSNKSVKEISFELGFSSPDYFSYFYKKHSGTSPSSLRKT